MAISTQISMEEYLHTSYRPDREYLDGEVRERNMGKGEHAEVQLMLGAWFAAHRRAWGIRAGSDFRTQVASTRVRVPDIVIVRDNGPLTGVQVEPPLLIVEILSPDDTYSDLKQRSEDYQRMGGETVWIIDPEARTAQIYTGQVWTAATRLTVEGSPIFLELAGLFADIDHPIS